MSLFVNHLEPGFANQTPAPEKLAEGGSVVQIWQDMLVEKVSGCPKALTCKAVNKVVTCNRSTCVDIDFRNSWE